MNNVDAEFEISEKERIAEMKSLSYLERLERLMILIEVSYTLKIINEISIKNQSKYFYCLLYP